MASTDSGWHWHPSDVVIGFLGFLFFGLYLAYILTNEAYLRGPPWLFPLGLGIISTLSTGLLIAAGWLGRRDVDGDNGWQVVLWCLSGVIGALALTFWPIFYQRIVGVTIEDPLFILLVSVGIGANAGVIAGVARLRRQRQFEEVERTRDSLQFLNRTLRHHVLNAVNIIQGNADDLIDENLDERVTRRSRTIRFQSERIQEHVETTKTLIRHAEGPGDIHRVELTEALKSELERARETSPAVVFETDIEDGVEVRANPLISKVIENVLSNSIHHNDRDIPKISIRLSCSNAEANLEIADNGPGIPDEHKEAVFQPGRHGDEGLGLYLVRSLIDHYDGDIDILDNEPRGTVVRIRLPLADAGDRSTGALSSPH